MSPMRLGRVLVAARREAATRRDCHLSVTRPTRRRSQATGSRVAGSPRDSWRAGLFTALTLLAAAVPAAAQGNRPLTKTDLIQLITSRNRTQSDMVEVIRRNCLTFSPTTRDLRDLRVQGAGPAVLEAVENCTRAPAPQRLVVPKRVRATAGQQVTIAVRVLRNGRPERGVTVLLRGAAAIPGGSAQEPGGVSDARGVARIPLLAGVRPGTYRLEVATADGGTPPVALQLVTVAANTGLLAAVRPSVVRLRRGSRSGATLQVAVQDRSGRPVPGVALELAGITAQIDTGGGLHAVTDRRGVATFVIPPGAVRHGGQVGVYSAGTPLASIDMLLERVVLSRFRTQFRSGTDQRGAVQTALRQPLVFEVRDTTGMPVVDYPVHFTATNGTVVPADTTTDTAGVARATVTLGARTGAVTVTATAGTVRKEASLYATPGPAKALVVERGGRAIDSVLSIGSRDSVSLRVVARDAFGNEALLERLQVAVSGRAGAVALRSLRGAAAPGAVVLEPRRGGTATLAVRASGLTRTIPIVVDLPVHGTPWVLGALAGGAAFSYGYRPTATSVDGRPGFRMELTAGRRVGPPGLRVEGGLGLGVLRAAATGGANLAVPLFQGLVRGEYALLPDRGAGGGVRGVIPVVTLGGGLYRIKSTDAATMVYHTSLFWLIGAGVEWSLGPQLKGVARLERQQLYEANSAHSGADGSVGALTILEVGVRYSP